MGVTVFASLALAAVLAAMLPQVGFAQRAAPMPGGGPGLITFTASLGEHKQQVTVIDPETRTMAVYHIDGEIVLKSVRNIRYDLQMVEFNGSKPLPREIRSLAEQRQSP